MISLPLILLLLVLLLLFLLAIMLKLRKIGKSILGAPPSKIRRKLGTLGLKRLTLKSLNKRSNISVIIVELPVILDKIAISG